MSRSIFITATDTDAGKTYVTLDAIRQLRVRHIRARAIKPIACGINAQGTYDDLTALLEVQNITHEDAINCYRFARASAPAIAAADERQTLNPTILTQWCRGQMADQDILLIEGIGGLMVPLSQDYLLHDWIRDLQPDEIWLVARCRVGAINHMLLTLDKLQQTGLLPAHIILNATSPAEADYLPDMRHMLGAVAAGSKIHTLRAGESLNMRELCGEGESS